MSKRKRALTKKEKELKIYKGRYFVAEKNRGKAEDLVDKVSDSERQILLLNPKQETTLATARRTIIRDRKPLRITPKTPRLRR